MTTALIFNMLVLQFSRIIYVGGNRQIWNRYENGSGI